MDWGRQHNNVDLGIVSEVLCTDLNELLRFFMGFRIFLMVMLDFYHGYWFFLMATEFLFI